MGSLRGTLGRADAVSITALLCLLTASGGCPADGQGDDAGNGGTGDIGGPSGGTGAIGGSGGSAGTGGAGGTGGTTGGTGGGGAGGASGVGAAGGSGGTGGMDPPIDGGTDSGAGGVRTFPTDRAQFGLGGPSRCADANVLLCDGFEGNSIDTDTWQVQTWGSGSATLDTSRAARGSKSVHINEPAAVSRVMLRETSTFASTGNHFFGRFFLYLDYTSAPLSCPGGNCTNLIHWTAAAAGGDFVDGSGTYRPDVRAIGAVNQRLLVNLDGAPVPEVGVDDDDSVPGYEALGASHTNEWMCFEFEYAGEGAAAEVRVYWDGIDHPALHYSTSNRGDDGELWSIPTYDYLELGFAHYQDYGAFVSDFNAWIDEVVVDDERVGCAL